MMYDYAEQGMAMAKSDDSGDLAKLPPAIRELLQKTQTLVPVVDSQLENAAALSVEDRLRAAMGSETDVVRLRQMGYLLGEFAKLTSSAADSGATEDGAFAVSVDSPFEVRLTLVPSRPQGKPVPLRDVVSRLKELGIHHGVSKEALQSAWDCAARRRETVWRLLVAAGSPAVNGEDASLTFAVRAFDKRLLLDPTEPFFGDLAAMIEEVKAGALVARITPGSPGTPGYDVRGNKLPAAPGAPASLGIGEGVQLPGDGREAHAVVPGSLVVGEETIDIIPFHVVEGQVGVGQDITFDGSVLVTGHVTGPVRIQARDIYIAGNAETASLSASGDVWVGGAIHGKSAIEAEGRVFARSITDAGVRAIGDIRIGQSIVESRVSSGGRVLLDPARGQIEGGEVSAFQGVVAHSLGSSYGTPTAVHVATADLRGPLLGELEKKIRQIEEAATKIEDLKSQLQIPKSGPSGLAPDQLGLYVSLLRKEIQVLEELRMLRRRRNRLDSKSVAGAASIQTSGVIHPFVTVEIGEVSEQIGEPLTGVTLALGPDRKLAVVRPDAARSGPARRK